MRLAAPAASIPGMRDMPAGFQNTVLASSAAAAPPAKALPNPLPLCSCNAKAEPKACPPASASAAPASAAATRVRRNGCDLICSLLLMWNDALLLRFFGLPESPDGVADPLYTAAMCGAPSWTLRRLVLRHLARSP